MLPLYDNLPTRRFPFVTVALIAVNAAVWRLYQVPDLRDSVFAHGDWMHIIGNMLFLWIFGKNVEDALGRIRYLVFYLAAGVAATAAQTVATLGFGTAEDATIPAVGASGAIAGVLGAYLLLYPLARVVTLVFVFFVEIPAMFFLVTWFLFQLWLGGFSLVEPQSGGGIAFFAHIGGFVFGALAVRPLVPRRPP